MPDERGGDGPDDPSEQRLAEIRELARAYLDDQHLPIFVANRAKVMELAGRLGSIESWQAFASMVRQLHRSDGRTNPSSPDLANYLRDLKPAVMRIINARPGTQGMARIENIDQMIDSGAPYLVCAGLLLKHRRGRLWFDDFLHQIRSDWRGDGTDDVVIAYEVGDETMHRIKVWLMARDVESLGHVSMTVVNEAVAYVANLDKRDVLVDHIRGVSLWDGVERLKELMSIGFGARVDDASGQTAEYLAAVGRNLMISLVARGLRAGCKVDTMPVFLGAQGIFKSTAMAILGGSFYREISESPTNKDFYVALRGCWLGEIAEMASIASSKVEINKVKAMLSRVNDHYRDPYARVSKDHLRRNVFSGTGNPTGTGMLRDETGNRRFWPVLCGLLDLDWLRLSREQIVAEALKRFEDGESWWEVPAEAHRVAVERYQQVSVHEETLRERLLSASLYDGTPTGPNPIKPDITAVDDRTRWGNLVQVDRVAVQWLGSPLDQAGRLQVEISAALTRLGWRRYHISIRTSAGPRKVWGWIVADEALRAAARAGGELHGPAYISTDDDQIPF